MLRACLIVVCLWVTGCESQRAETVPAKPVKATKPVSSREDFRKVLLGRTPEEVLRLVGKPDSTTDLTTFFYWIYEDRVRDSVTGKIGRAIVTFENGIVDRVSF